jgi:hypothetical protein
MKIITISVDDELYRKSRQKAAGTEWFGNSGIP